MGSRFVLMCIAASLVALLAYFAAITVTFIPGVAALYPAAAFEAAFGCWFGLWGAIASYVGLLIAGSAGGWFPIQAGILLSLSDFLLAFAPFLFVRYGFFDPSLPDGKHAFRFWVIALLFGSLPGSLLYNYVNMQLGAIAGWTSFWVGVVGWNIGNAVVLAALGIPLLRIGTPIMKARGLVLLDGKRGD